MIDIRVWISIKSTAGMGHMKDNVNRNSALVRLTAVNAALEETVRSALNQHLGTGHWKSSGAQKSKYSILPQAGWNNNLLYISRCARPWVRLWNIPSLACASVWLMPRPSEGLAQTRGWYFCGIRLLVGAENLQEVPPSEKQCPFITVIISGRSAVSLAVSPVWQRLEIHSLWLHREMFKIWWRHWGEPSSDQVEP